MLTVRQPSKEKECPKSLLCVNCYSLITNSLLGLASWRTTGVGSHNKVFNPPSVFDLIVYLLFCQFCSFDANGAVNAQILSNLQAVQTNTDYNPVIIRRKFLSSVLSFYPRLFCKIYIIGAMRIYFRTLKAKEVRKSNGKQTGTISKQRRHQRMINVSLLIIMRLW